MNQKYYLTILVVSVVVFFTGCKHTVVEETYPDGAKKRVCVYRGRGDHKEILSETTYYENGQILMTGAYRNEKRHGRWLSYYQNGTIWSEGHFLNGLKDGKSVTWFENGKIRYEGFFRQDIRTGTWRFYDETGKILQEVDYTQGK
jgi:antitoxin component YwqK of YwqJK toxin-antitoxin module